MADHPQFETDAHVRLKSGINPGIYGEFGVTGAEGWLRGYRPDRFGLFETYIEWDKNHWAYNGAPDGWTFEEHFELIEEEDTVPKDKVTKLAEILAQALSEDDEPQVVSKKKRPDADDMRNRLQSALVGLNQDDEEDDTERIQAAETAADRIRDAESFIVVGIDREPHPKAPEGLMRPFIIPYFSTPESQAFAFSQMALLASNAHQELAVEYISRLLSE